MSSENNNNIAKSSSDELPLKELAKTRGTLPAKYDLDKNPIKFKQWDGSFSTEAHDKDYMELTLRSGKHSDLVQKLLRQKIEARAQDWPRWPASVYGGTRLMWIESRYWYDRERLCANQFDDDWRRYRSMYLNSLNLHPDEPIRNPEYEKFMINPIRRFYMKGGDWIEKNIIQKFTNDRFKSERARVLITRPWLFYAGFVLLYYRFRYINERWEDNRGQMYAVAKPRVFPGDAQWPWKEVRTSQWHHNDPGFLARNVYKDLRDFEDTTVIL